MELAPNSNMRIVRRYAKMWGIFAVVWVLALSFVPAAVPAGPIAEAFETLKKYKRPPAPPEAEQTLRDIWGPLIARYPSEAIRSLPHTLTAVESIPAVYRREHRVFRHGADDWMRRLEPYDAPIREASWRFDVPPEVIRAVILQESGGNEAAQAKDTSAKGLMQTIDATFTLARDALATDDLQIRNPLTGRDSIFAGTWYLAYCFDLAARDYPEGDRKNPQSWRRALEYYYAGPGWGRDPRPIIHVYRNGKRTRIHKARYSDGVLGYVAALNARTAQAGEV